MRGLQGLSGNEEVPTSLPSTSGGQKEGEAHLQALIIKRGHAAADPPLVPRRGPAGGLLAQHLGGQHQDSTDSHEPVPQPPSVSAFLLKGSP